MRRFLTRILGPPTNLSFLFSRGYNLNPIPLTSTIVKVSNYLASASHKGKLSRYRSFLNHSYRFYNYISRILRRNSNKDKVFFFLLDKKEQQKHFKKIVDNYNSQLKYKMNNNIGHSGSREEGVSSFIMSKIMDAYKTTKDSPYVKSIYEETTSAFNNLNDKDKQNKSIDFSNSLPENTTITLYPNYCRHDNGEYITRVKGVVTAEGIMSRKNRFLLSMARRLTRTNDSGTIDSLGPQFEAEIEDAITNQDNYKPRDDESSIYSNATNISKNDTVKSRMEGILAKTIPGTPLNITVGSETPVDQLLGANLTSDSFGIFYVSIVTPYKPSYVAVSSVVDPLVLQTIPVEIVEPEGVSIITDIDDTIRLTGVLGDKRELFRNIFSKPYSSCEISGVSQWFRELHDVYKCSIHYVSNSPWQVFDVVEGFMTYFNFPITSVHLRQYSGNLVASFTQPSAERKRPSIVSLFDEFPRRKFILIGDTGEQDLEAYLSLIPNYSPQIAAIYLRVVPTSLSSLGNDSANLQELRKLLEQRSTGAMVVGGNKKTSNNLIEAENKTLDEVITDIADTTVNVTKVKKLAPIVPKKPVSLRSSKVLKSEIDVSGVHDEDVEKHLLLQPNSNTSENDYNDYVDSDEDIMENRIFGDDVDILDKKFNLWKQKIHRIIDEVPEHIQVDLWEDTKRVHDDSIRIVKSELK